MVYRLRSLISAAALGIISSRDDYYIKKNNLLVTTQNSIYKFRLINKEVNTDDKT